ncbi:SAM-dependent methyltransferase [Aeromicrobium wangtongii]|uniref:Methyltransferase domain-containing protein n=1 Tax=Aeromicrobium wangtongii TaxID=2969247 RepID=A0ABY5M458_9ACTN|nr:methyltransferase domain-containing protein [Aeromicrobium wangtongii]MCD9199007.1 methyltransferase domain-containing protein [Aeromicrobium wangtongii]UUP12960.1 methyltransferase domain-containing protein [Aeromicrobium wangtongii]
MSQDLFTEDYWDDRYASEDRIWSGQPNPQLVDRIAAMAPGRALDVGCGEGADAIWLAQQGWTVTALDVSQVALDRAARHAADAGVADAITWHRVDLSAWAGEPGAYDLVSAQFMYLPPPALPTLYRQLGDGVAPGGTLLLVGHHPIDERPGDHDFPDIRWTPEEAVEWLDADDWTSIETATVRRQGHSGTMHDGIVQATRA